MCNGRCFQLCSQARTSKRRCYAYSARSSSDPQVNDRDVGDPEIPGDLGVYVSSEGNAQADARRDTIAQQMWDDYIVYIEQNPGAVVNDLI